MTVETAYQPKSYKPGSAMAAEAVPWPFANPEDLLVTHIADATGVRTVLSLGNDYGVSGNGMALTGKVTAMEVWPANDLFEIRRATAREQLAKIPAHEPLPSVAMQQAIDRPVLILQEQDERLAETRERAFMVPLGETAPVVPVAAGRANKFLSFGPDGKTIIMSSGTGGGDMALRTDIAAPQGAGMVGLDLSLPAAEGTVAKQFQDMQRIAAGNIMDYIPRAQWSAIELGTATTDIAPYLQAAFVAKKSWRAPAGLFPLSHVTLDSLPYRKLIGESGATIFAAIGGGDLFAFPDNTAFCSLLSVSFTNLAGTHRTNGQYVRNDSDVFEIRDIFATLGLGMLRNTGTLIEASDFDMREFTPGAGVGIAIYGGFALKFEGIRGDNNPAAMPATGFYIFESGDVITNDFNLVGWGTDYLIQPGAGKVVSSLTGDVLILDTSIVGLHIDTSLGGFVGRCTWGLVHSDSHSGKNVIISATNGPIDGVTINTLQTHFGGDDGLLIEGEMLKSIKIGQHECGGKATKSAVVAREGARNWTILEPNYGQVDGTTSPVLNGIVIEEDNENYRVEGGSIDAIANAISDASKTGVIRNVKGVVTRNKGNSQIDAGTSSKVITHGLLAAPKPEDIHLSFQSNHGNNPAYVDPSSITATQFTVRTGSNAGINQLFGWVASCLEG